MLQLVSEYLDNVTSGIKNQKRQMAVRAELAGHFAESIEAFTQTGLSEEGAARQTILRMGSEFEVQHKLTKANRQNPGLAVFLASAGLLFFTLYSTAITGAVTSLLITLGLGAGFALLGGVQNLTPSVFFKRTTVTGLYAGALGFLIGLVNLLGNLGDPATMGLGMSSMLFAAFYGLLLSGVSFGLKTLLATWKPKSARETLGLHVSVE